ncbi:MAG: porin family protein [Flavobacteriales bacterium]|nr:porin family protein [Flavobacteriales bacterium]
MKKLFGLLMLVAAFTFAANNANAQESFGSAGLEIALPIGDFGDAANLGIGGSGNFEIGLSDQFAVLAHAGVLFYSVDDIEILGTTIETSITQIPLQVGGRYYLSEQKEGLFLSGLVGVHINSTSANDESDSTTDLSFAPEVGFFLNENISLSLRYQFITSEVETIDPVTFETTTENQTNSYLGVRAAYNF